MSGHSKWATIKRKKEVKDKKRGKLFSSLVKDITIAARNGRDIETNPNLKMAIAKAKKNNLPQLNIDRAIDRGASVSEGKAFEVTYGLLGPNGMAAIIEVITDNKNRSLSDIRKAIEDAGFKFADGDSVMWNFERQGYVVVDGKINEEIQLELIDVGAEDFLYNQNDNETRIVVNIDDLETLKSKLGEDRYEDSGLGYFPKDKLSLDQSVIDKLDTALEDQDDIESIWGNWM